MEDPPNQETNDHGDIVQVLHKHYEFKSIDISLNGNDYDFYPPAFRGNGYKTGDAYLIPDTSGWDTFFKTDADLSGFTNKINIEEIKDASLKTGNNFTDATGHTPTFAITNGFMKHDNSVNLGPLRGTLPDISGGNANTGTTTGVAPSGGSGTGLEVTVKTLDGDATKLESITVTNGGRGYKVGEVITFAAKGDGTAAGDYGDFEYILVEADVDVVAENVYIDSDKITVTNKNVTDNNANGATFQLIRETNDEIKIKVINEGDNYQAGDILTISSIANPA